MRPQTLERLAKIAEVVVLRAAPGLLNVATLVSLGAWLGANNYGLFSTGLATTGLCANLIFGPVISSIVSEHAKIAALGNARAYESALVSTALLMACATTAATIPLIGIGLIPWSWAAPIATFGIYTALQEIPHARLKFWSFGAAALTQAGSFLVLAWAVVRPHPSIDAALLAFSASYGIAAVLSYALSGLPPIAWPKWRLMSGAITIGVPYTLSTVAENGLFLGIRYALLLTGATAHLSTFSYCVDISQRFAGFLISAISFRSVPEAFKAAQVSGADAFHKELTRGAVFAIALATPAVGIVLVLNSFWPKILGTGSLFNAGLFAITSAAIIVNRTKKLSLDPIALRGQQASSVVAGYLMGAFAALALTALALRSGNLYGVGFAYLAGYLTAALTTALILSRSATPAIARR
ncbi:hypothetical protein [Caulobacter sp. 17J65-9]|uniref:hypothetical protein n=1 Tax=Caulobacter sp. 17J65-9 TaxID=2709382 RepID=UPI0013CA9FA3|nr:hypothetical protein [Caulobacter sp. 17J65-9]NEX92349.1 hypothetical protein [Caulobacter sp. 17J65-9]